jgi:hypothetical protein
MVLMSISCLELAANFWHEINMMSISCLDMAKSFWREIDIMHSSCLRTALFFWHEIDISHARRSNSFRILRQSGRKAPVTCLIS